ncbi:hypothetical protein BXY85_1529 [Roseivirga pacifica]|uniref:Uncharacterized protein n=1 Tax=Roseivirga pacifica TaxID=1267423 RepID=A0A1I0MMA5_9BACT|nr:hypothetical protein [Roseivirga pacifica]MCO6359062.1 hypothetical protein [Roseivirga pacifica]MCO6365302.1 hypothetical protein [Roseivirga pacifica]MCO6371968.1 hypothetical protein [Roseivirga pacifica]MCO6375921.1 hypothetical protein [Roseivirga pacifica]MCO6379346.1 hypothetical protein [Roseivirga pacifica]
MRLKALLIVAFLAVGFVANAQFNFPEDPEQRSEAQTLWTLFDDSYKQGNYEAAKAPLEKLITKFPKLSSSVYINGIKVWDESVESAKDDAARIAAADKVMQLYQLRYDNFPGDEAEVIDRQANHAFRYYFKDAEKTNYTLDLFKKTYELKGNEAFYPVARYYMQAAALAFTRKTGITDQEILAIYDRVSEHIDYQIAQAKAANKSTSRYVKTKEDIDNKLADLNLIDCAFITEKLVPEFQQNPNDAELANKIFAFAYSGGCTDEAWFTQAAEVVFTSSPNYGVGYMLGVKFGADKEFDKSKEYFLKSVELTDDNTDKGKAFKQIATTERIQENYSEARKYAIQAVEVDPTLKEDMYTMIGDMVMASSSCDKLQSQVDDRARFIAAYDYYAAAGNAAKMSQAKAQFPTIGDIFTANKEEGQTIQVGCWIQKSVKLQRRPE